MAIKIQNISCKTTTEEFLKCKKQKEKNQNSKIVAFGEHIINFMSKSRDRFSLTQFYLREPSGAMVVLY